jgi:hypothetical protein
MFKGTYDLKNNTRRRKKKNLYLPNNNNNVNFQIFFFFFLSKLLRVSLDLKFSTIFLLFFHKKTVIQLVVTVNIINYIGSTLVNKLSYYFN